MKIACVADIHAHNFREFDQHSDNTGSVRLDRIVDTMVTILDYCVSNSIRVLLIAGDVFNTRGKVNTIVHNAMLDILLDFAGHGIKVIIAVGNHDQADNSETPPNSLHPIEDDDICVMDECGFEDVWDNSFTLSGPSECTRIVCVPYNKNTDKIKQYIQSHVDAEERSYRNIILLAHVGVSGANVSDNYPMQDAFKPEDLHPDFFKYVVLGHYHIPQVINGFNNMFYCGSPIQHSFNDEGQDRGFWVVDTDKRCDMKFIPIPNPKFVTLKWPTTADELQTLANGGHYVRMQLKESEVQQFQAIVPQNLKYKVDLQRVYETKQRVDVKIGMSFEEIISQYAEEFNPGAKQLGLEILSKAVK